jgi:hypothetical protein
MVEEILFYVIFALIIGILYWYMEYGADLQLKARLKNG